MKKIVHGKGYLCNSQKKEENTLTRGSDVSSVNSIVPTYEDAISLGSIFLLSKLYIDIQLLYPVSYPSAVTLYTWHFPPFILLSFFVFSLSILFFFLLSAQIVFINTGG